MHVARRILFAASILLFPVFAMAKANVTTLQVGTNPTALAANTVTNKIYIANTNSANVTVINGATNQGHTVAADSGPDSVAVNESTNKIYVADFNAKLVTVIDGATESTVPVAVGDNPNAIAVNPVTNQIYTANRNSVTIIDGATLRTTVITVPFNAVALAVNPVTNKIYVVSSNNSKVTVIDGASGTVDATLTVGANPNTIAINTLTNRIYVGDYNAQGITIIHGEDNSTVFLTTGNNPYGIAVNQQTNKVYVANYGSNNVSVIDGTSETIGTDIAVQTRPYNIAVNTANNLIYVTNQGSNSVSIIQGDPQDVDYNKVVQTVGVGRSPQAIIANSVSNRTYNVNPPDNSVSVISYANAQFVAIAPCRLVDTRGATGQFGGPPLQGMMMRTFTIPQNQNCNIPTTATAYSLNITVAPHGPLGYLTIWPTGGTQPSVSTLNSPDGRVKANAAIVPAGSQGGVNVYVTNTTDLIMDIDGYFVPASTTTLAFYPLAPCRVADTRNPNGDLGGPFLHGQVPRDFPVMEATDCHIPQNAKAYSLNFTAIPHGPLGYLTVWPTGQNQPNVSTLNAPTGTVTANAGIVPVGTGGKVSTFASNDTDLLIDIDGYFADPGVGGLSLYNLTPCRVLDTRSQMGRGPFQGTLNPPIDVLNSPCQPPAESQAYVFNATVVPHATLGYLTLWPDGLQQPTVSTLNAVDRSITSNLAIVPAGASGKVDAFASGTTDLLLDISGYFGPLQP
jgi:YVTN family beta-propeller protein